MKETSRGKLTKLAAVLLAVTVAFGMIPMSAAPASADSNNDTSGNSNSEQNLKAVLYTFDDSTPYYYHSDDWVSGSVYVEVEGIIGDSAVKAAYKKSASSEWTDVDFSSVIIEDSSAATEPVENIEETTQAADADGEEGTDNTVPSVTETVPEPANPSRYKFKSNFWISEPNGTYDGSYDFKYEFSDGSTHTYSGFFSAMIDNVLDELDVETKAAAGKWYDKAVFNGSVEDKGSGLDELTVSYGDITEKISPDENGKFSYEMKNDYQGDVEFAAVDKAGNSVKTGAANICIDTSAPEVTEIKVSPESWTNKSVDVCVKAKDALSGIGKVCYIIEKDGVEPSEKNAKEAALNDDENYQFTITTEDIKGSKGSAIVYAVDNAGNSTFSDTNRQSISVNIDTEKCIITELSVTPDSWTCGEAEVKGKIIDNASGVDKDSVMYKVSAAGETEGKFKKVKDVEIDDDGVANFSVKLNTPDKKLDTGVYNVEITAKDNVGNGSVVDESLLPTSYPLTVRIQTTPPKFEGISYTPEFPEGVTYTNSDIIVSGQFLDKLSGMDNGGSVEYRSSKEGSEWEKADLHALGNGMYQFSFKISQSHTGIYWIRATNAAGARTNGTLRTKAIYIDKDAPVFDEDSIEISNEWASSAVINGKVHDEGASGIDSISYRFSGSKTWNEIIAFEEKTETASFQLELEGIESDSRIEFMCTDKAGNETVYSPKQDILLDVTAPEIKSTETDYKGDWTNTDIEIKIEASDSEGNVKSGIGRVYGELINDGEEKAVAEKDAVLNSEGTYTLTLKASDFADDNTGEGIKKGGFKGKVIIKAVDNAKNVSSNSEEIQLSIDTEKGVAGIAQYERGWTNRSLKVELQYFDAKGGEPYSSGYGNITCNDKDGNEIDISKTIKGNEITVIIPQTDYNGEYNLAVSDKAGNITDGEGLTVEAKLDCQKPEITGLDVNVTEKWTNTPITIKGKAVDTKASPSEYNSGVKSVLYKKAAAFEWQEAEIFNAANGKFTINLPDEVFDGVYEVKCIDYAGNESDIIATKEIQYDGEAPVITELTADPSGWTNGEVTITGWVRENGSGINSIEYQIPGKSYTIAVDKNDISSAADEKGYKFTQTIKAQSFCGEYTFTCLDNAYNRSEDKAVSFKQDNKAPEIKAERSEPLIKSIIEGITFNFFNFGKPDTSELQYTLDLTDDCSGLNLDSLTMTYTDKNGNEKTVKVKDDQDVLDNVQITEGDDRIADGGPLNAKATFTVKENMATNISFAVSDVASDDNKGSYVNEKDKLIVDTIAPGRTVAYSPPVAHIKAEDREAVEEYTDKSVFENERLYYDENTVAELTFTVEETNFYPEDINAKEKEPENEQANLDNCKFTLIKDGDEENATFLNPEWIHEGDSHKATITIDSDGSYIVKMEYMDRSMNEMASYTSPEIIIDTIAPVLDVEYENKDSKETLDGRTYYSSVQKATVTVTEKNFDEDCFEKEVITKMFNLKADNATEEIDVPEAYTLGEWTHDGDDHAITVSFDKDANFDFSAEYIDFCNHKASYEDHFTVDTTAPVLINAEFRTDVLKRFLNGITFGYYKDNVNVTLTFFDAVAGVEKISGKGILIPGVSSVNKAFEAEEREVRSADGITTVSFEIPSEALNENFDGVLKVTAADRSTNTAEMNPCDWKADVNADKTPYGFVIDNKKPGASITLNAPANTYKGVAYYNGNIEGSITVDEANFDSNYFENDLKLFISENDLINKKERYDISKDWESSNDVRKNSFRISKEGKYSYNFNYKDPSGNASDELSAGNLVIDKTAPTGIFAQTKEKRERDGSKYYDGDITLSFTITEHNFSAEDVEFIADGEKTVLAWLTNGDVHTASYVFKKEGVHSYSLNYSDLATNNMKEIADEKLVIDLTDPKLKIDYSFKPDEGHSYDGRQYLDHTCTAVVTVEEHNFCEEDTHIIIDRLNSAGEGNSIDKTAIFGEWEHSGDLHKISINFKDDYNYTVNATCLDLATRSINPYSPDLFTVDTVSPGEIHFSYSEPVRTEPIGGTAFRFYNNQVKVEISAYDETSGVHQFDYRGILASGVSAINREIYKTAIEEAEITRSGTTFTAAFYIPQSALSDSNQFNGTITSGAADRSGNTVETADTTRIVADNIKPKGKISRSTENETHNNRCFYGGNVTLSLEIEEANFYADDVAFKVNDDTVNLNWNSNGDIHTAEYVISGEREHSYSLEYKDRSGNEIEQSDPANAPLTNDKIVVIDRTKPVITIDKMLKNESANKDETISFILTVTDKYFDSDKIDPELESTTVEKVSVSDENALAPEQYESHLKTSTQTLENPVSSGESYVYTINNLETDGYYRFTCTAKDYAGNTQTEIECTDSDDKDQEVEHFDFSVNRDGSAFWVDWGEEVKADVTNNNGYTNSDNVSVIIHEFNVDKTVEGTSLKIVNNDDTVEVGLNEENYSGNKPTGHDGWYNSSYTLDNSYFLKDSRYTVSVTTRDKAGNVNISGENEISLVSFTVDRTAPIISSNVSDNQIIKSNGYEIEANVVEDNLDENSLGVYIDDNPVDFKREGKLVKFDFDNGTHSIKIAAADLAKNNADDYVITNLTVSDNPIVLWFANKPLFFATTGGALVLIGAVIFFVIKRGQKKKAG